MFACKSNNRPFIAFDSIAQYHIGVALCRFRPNVSYHIYATWSVVNSQRLHISKCNNPFLLCRYSYFAVAVTVAIFAADDERCIFWIRLKHVVGAAYLTPIQPAFHQEIWIMATVCMCHTLDAKITRIEWAVVKTEFASAQYNNRVIRM